MDTKQQSDYGTILEVANRQDFFSSYAGAHYDSVSPECAQAHFTAERAQCNPFGIVHGGVYYTVMDQLTGMCVAASGMAGVTIDSSVSYLSSAKLGDTVTCRADCVHLGRSVAVYEAKCCGADGTLQCSGTFHLLLKGPVEELAKLL